MDLNLRQQYDDLGYAIASQLFMSSEMAQFSQLIDPIYDQWMQDNKTSRINEKLINMHALTHPRYFESNPSDRARLFDHIASPKLTELLERMFGTGLYFHNTQLFFNPHSLEKRPYWHRDL